MEKTKKGNRIGLILVTVFLTVAFLLGSLAVSYFYSPGFKNWVDYTLRQQAVVDDQADTIAGLQADLTALNNQLNTVTEQRDVALGEKQQLLLDIADLEGEIVELQAQLNDALTQNEQDLALIADLQETITAKDNLITQKNATITQLNNEIAELEQDIEDLNVIIADLQAQLSGYNTMIIGIVQLKDFNYINLTDLSETMKALPLYFAFYYYNTGDMSIIENYRFIMRLNNYASSVLLYSGEGNQLTTAYHSSTNSYVISFEQTNFAIFDNITFSMNTASPYYTQISLLYNGRTLTYSGNLGYTG